jgi:DNA-directed RNA polymerase specialized sigma24 family protein
MARRDAEAFTAFVLAGQPRLRRTAYLMCGDWALASDFVQEALIRVYRHWPRLRSDGEAHAYARKAVVSVVIDAKRRRSSTEVPVRTSSPAPWPISAPARAAVSRCRHRGPAAMSSGTTAAGTWRRSAAEI